MDIVRTNGDERIVIKTNASEGDFFALMKKAKARYGIKNIQDGIFKEGANPYGFIWPNAHKLEFSARGFIYRYEFLGDIDMNFSEHKNIIMTNKKSTDYLSLFDKVEVNKTQQISDHDRKYCENQQAYLDDTLKQLTIWYRYLLEASVLELQENDCYSRDERGDVRKKYYSGDVHESVAYKAYRFTPLYDLKHIEGLKYRASYLFEQRIVNHFNSTYGLRIERKDLYKDKEFVYQPKYGEVITYIIESLDGKNFSDVAHKLHVDDFRNAVHWKKPTIKGNTVTIPDLLSFDYNYNNGLRISHYSKDRFTVIYKGIYYFETKIPAHTPETVIEYWNENFARLDEPYTLKTTKATNLRFFKNGRVDIKFSDNQSAQEFFNFYRLHEKYED